MSIDDNISYFVGIYGFMQLSMMDVGLVDPKGFPIKKKYNMTEQDAMFLYNWVSGKIKDVPQWQLRALGSETDKRVSKLISGHAVVNNFLLSIMLLREYVDNDAPKHYSLMLSPKINRIIEMLDEAVSDEEFDVNIKRTTARTANNLYRQMIGKPQLSDEIRDIVANKYRK